LLTQLSNGLQTSLLVSILDEWCSAVVVRVFQVVIQIGILQLRGRERLAEHGGLSVQNFCQR
jgi:hypothetical protein